MLLSLGGMVNIQQHTFALVQYTHSALSSLRYLNGAPVVRIYSDSEFSSPDVQGPIINFNVLDDGGKIIGYSQVGFDSLFLGGGVGRESLTVAQADLAYI
jgi:hypothetical protein